MLKDKVKITVYSGKGGNGSQATFNLRRIGGDGGHGGNVVLRGDENTYDLRFYKSTKKYRAEDGKNGEKMNRKGANGKDLFLKLPLTTEVYVDGKLHDVINEHGEEVEVLKGGRCGVGSVSIGKRRTFGADQKGEPGKTLELELVFKMQSDVVFIGYPNAGKSSMLNELTGTNVKTASYAFTTLDPQIGYMDGLKLVDLPGLIEGTSEGKGLGTRFLRHTENCKLVAHFVSLENEDPLVTYKSLRDEIKKIDTELFGKPELIVLTKTDEIEVESVKRTEQIFKEDGLSVISCSIIDDQSIRELAKKLSKSIKK